MEYVSKHKWLLASGAASAVGVVLGLRFYRRKREAEAARLFAILNLQPGAIVAEIGAGKGQFTVLAAQRLHPGGRVFSTEFEPKRLRKIRRSVEKQRLQNITTTDGSQTGAELPAQTFDAIYMRGVYHHFTAPQEMNRSLFRALRPAGLLAVIDFPPRWILSFCTPKGIPDNRGGHGIRKELLKLELASEGFQVVSEHDDWDSSMYCVVFRKPPVEA